MTQKEKPQSSPANSATLEPRSQPAEAPASPEPAWAKEDAEPTANPGTVPIWLVALLGIAVFVADIYVMNYGADIGGKGGSFPAQVYAPYRSYAQVENANPRSEADILLAQGRQLFEANCAPCHQTTGAGNPGNNIPPLAGSEWVLTPGPGRAIRVVLNSLKGPVTVKGQTYDNPAMPPWRPTLSDEQIAAILTYVRGNKDWGHGAAPVQPEHVKKIRAATEARGQQWTAAELQQVPATE